MACGTELQDSINVRNQKERVEKFLKEVLIIMDKNLIEMWCYHRSLSGKIIRLCFTFLILHQCVKKY